MLPHMIKKSPSPNMPHLKMFIFVLYYNLDEKFIYLVLPLSDLGSTRVLNICRPGVLVVLYNEGNALQTVLLPSIRCIYAMYHIIPDIINQ